MVAFAPSVQMTDVPRDPVGLDSEAEGQSDDQDEDENKDVRYTQHRIDKMIVDDDGLVSDSDGEQDEERKQSGRRNVADHRRLTSPVKGADQDEDMTEIAGTVPGKNGSAGTNSDAQHQITLEEVIPPTPVDTASNNSIPNQHTPEPASEFAEVNGDTMMVDVPVIA
jgi:histone deacetylase 1/2